MNLYKVITKKVSKLENNLKVFTSWDDVKSTSYRKIANNMV